MSKADINSWTGTCRLGETPEIRYTTTGKPVIDLKTCITVGWGERQKAVWTKFVVWGKQAEYLGQYAEKGDLLVISGAQYVKDEFEGKEGPKTVHYFEVGSGGQVNVIAKSSKNSGGGRNAPAEKPEAQNEPTQEEAGAGW